VRAVRKRKKINRKNLWTFAKRAAILLGAVLFAASLFVVLGWENVSLLGVVREAVAALAEAAADAFGEAE
jgi:type IV secretory pathway TrbD component